MGSLYDDLDPRLVLLAIDGYYATDTSSSSPEKVNGHMILSKVGIHFYYPDRTDYRKVAAHHIPFADILYVDLPRSGKSKVAIDRSQERYRFRKNNLLRNLSRYDVGVKLILSLGEQLCGYKVGLTAASARGDVARAIAGIYNIAQRMGTKERRNAWLESIEEAKRQSPPFFPSNESPHISRMQYFANASALGPAIFYANLALECAKLQSILARGPRFLEKRILKRAGYDKDPEFPIMTPQEIITLKRQRAWLLVDGFRYQVLINESKEPDSDPEVQLVYGIALAIGGSGEQRRIAATFFNRALALDPQNPKIVAGAAWQMALQQRITEASQMIASVKARASLDRYAMLLSGYAEEAMSNYSEALNYYLQSATLSHGYYEGTLACLQALSVAERIGNIAVLETAQRLTQKLPQQREAWEGLVRAANNMGATDIARQAQEHVTLMQGTGLI